MADGVRAALGQLHELKLGKGAEAANAWLDELGGAGRYLVDVWASE